MTKELRLIKESFCRLHGLDKATALNIEYQGRNPATLNAMFILHGDGIPCMRYEHERISLTPHTLNRSLDLDSSLKLHRSDINAEMISAWFNTHTNKSLLPQDVGKLIIGDRVTVICSTDSMRFKHSFSMAFK